MNKFSSTMKNIPPKARLMLGLVVVISIVSVVIFSRAAFFSSSSDDAVGDEGSARLRSGPSSQQIGRSRPEDEIRIPEGSPLAQQLEENRRSERERAKESGGGYLAPIEFPRGGAQSGGSGSSDGRDGASSGARASNNDRLRDSLGFGSNQALGGSVDGSGANAGNGANAGSTAGDGLSASERLALQREEQRAATLSEEERRLERQRQAALDAARRQLRAQENEILQGELSRIRSGMGGLGGSLSAAMESVMRGESVVGGDVRRPVRPYKAYAGSGASGGQNGQGGTQQSGRELQSEGDLIAGSFMRNPEDYSRLDTNEVDGYREMARQHMGIGGAPDQAGGSGGRSGYSELSNPMNVSNEKRGFVISPGDMYYGNLDIGIDTDTPGPVRVTIYSGKFQGNGVLVGEPMRAEDTIRINLNTMTIDGGQPQTVSAVVLDPETLRPAIADDVDYHTFERYFKLAAAAAADGYVTALTGTRTQRNTDGSEVVERNALPRPRDQAAAAVGRIGQVMMPKFERDFERPPTVYAWQNREVIVFFTDRVEF